MCLCIVSLRFIHNNHLDERKLWLEDPRKTPGTAMVSGGIGIDSIFPNMAGKTSDSDVNKFGHVSLSENDARLPHVETDLNIDIRIPAEPKILYDGPPIRSQNHQRFLTVATMFKNERCWLREWIEFYIMMGVEYFIMYDNNSTDLPLEIIQPYIDKGYVTYILWPPKIVPPPINAASVQEQDRDEWFQDCLGTCLLSDAQMHRQGPCQMAAFIDAIRRTNGGVSRWLGIWDIDEFIFPPIQIHC
jgi:Glycosyltransferase family 92